MCLCAHGFLSFSHKNSLLIPDAGVASPPPSRLQLPILVFSMPGTRGGFYAPEWEE